MESREFHQVIREMQEEAEEVQIHSPLAEAELETAEAVSPEELRRTSEELQAVEDELRRQNEALLAAWRALDGERERYRNLFQLAPDGYLVTDGNTVIREANQAASELLNVSVEELIGRPLSAFIDDADASRFAIRLNRLRVARECTREMDWRFRMKPQGRKVLDATLTVAVDRSPRGQIIRSRWMIRDVSERRRIEREIRELNARLEKRVEERTRELEEANRAKDRFLAALSHELRTPLTPVLMAATALEAEGSKLPGEVLAMVKVIRRNVEMEARLIDDLLDLTRVAHGKLRLHMETVDAHALIEAVVDICADDVRSKKLTLVKELEAPQPWVRADSARLQQVMWNLVKNSVKFTPEGGRITLRTRNEPVSGEARGAEEANRGEGPGSWLMVEVSDTGVGIEPSALDRIFNPFEQENEQGVGQFGGLGLGLAISRALMDVQGGVLQARSEGKGRGATFAVRLEVAGEWASDIPVAAQPMERLDDELDRRLSILLVEDHADTARVMGRLLETMGHAVKTAGGVASARELARDEQFDLVISDLGLPDGSGIDLLRELQSHRATVAVALSGYGTDDDVSQSEAAGFMRHLTKPVNFQELKAVLRQVQTGDSGQKMGIR